MRAFPGPIHRALKRIVAEVSIHGPQLFRVGNGAPEMAASDVTRYPNEPLTDPLVKSLAERLYAQYYCRRTATRASRAEDTDMLDGLREANTSREGWVRGWEIVDRDEAGTVVVKNGARVRLAAPESYRVTDADRGHEVGMAVWRLREDAASQPDYYYAIGEALGDRYEDLVGSRIYVNLSADAATRWMRCVTQDFNRYEVPFAFKVLRNAAAYGRVDSGVLYLPRRHARFGVSIVMGLARVVGGLRRPTPLFTRRVASGIAISDNPPDGQSFGFTRMQLVAEGIVDAWRSRQDSVESRLGAISNRFRSAGLNLPRPWLNPGNVELDLPRRGHQGAAPGLASRTHWLDAADRIGCRIVRDAIWHENQCTWLGWSLIPGSDDPRGALRTAGGDLYGGTAGIALFLARLARVTGDPRQRATASAALRHAIARTARGDWRIGAYTGLAGVLHAASAVSDALRCEEAEASTPALLARLCAARPGDTELDIIEGRAGAIRGLLHAARRVSRGDGLETEAAARFGREIVALAYRDDGHWSWDTTGLPATRHLLGYSHGTSGIACALYQLFQVTGDRQFLQGADGALNYEWAGFDRRKRNWPDLRRHADTEPTGQSPTEHFMIAWCSGAPGTALALARRLAGADDAPFTGYLDEALGTTLASVAADRPSDREENFSLCHGIAGNSEILLQIDHVTSRPDLRQAVMAAAEEGIRRYHESGTWPCGIKDAGEAPGLLLGLAGIGHFYLRLHDPSIPTPLLL
jgi:hypothetical protein